MAPLPTRRNDETMQVKSLAREQLIPVNDISLQCNILINWSIGSGQSRKFIGSPRVTFVQRPG
jgi:hypothetical protein